MPDKYSVGVADIPKHIKGFQWFDDRAGRDIKIQGTSLIGNNKGNTRYAAVIGFDNKHDAKRFARRVKEAQDGPTARVLEDAKDVEEFRKEMVQSKGWSRDAPDGNSAITSKSGTDIRGDATGFTHGINPRSVRRRSVSRRRSSSRDCIRRASKRSRSKSPRREKKGERKERSRSRNARERKAAFRRSHSGRSNEKEERGRKSSRSQSSGSKQNDSNKRRRSGSGGGKSEDAKPNSLSRSGGRKNEDSNKKSRVKDMEGKKKSASPKRRRPRSQSSSS